MKTISKKSFAVVLSVLMALSALTVCPVSAFASTIPAKQTAVGTVTTVNTGSEIEYYAFQAPETATYAVMAQSDTRVNLDSKSYAYDSEDNFYHDSSSGKEYVNYVWNGELCDATVNVPAASFVSLKAGEWGYLAFKTDNPAAVNISVNKTLYRFEFTTYSAKLTYNVTDYDDNGIEYLYPVTSEFPVGVSANITHYYGYDRAIAVPSTVFGYPVTAISELVDGNARKSITAVTLPDIIERIGGSCFNRYTSLSSINMPANLKYVESAAFAHCTSLKGRLALGEGVEYVGESAFYNTGYDSVYIGAKKAEIGQYAFGYKDVLDASTSFPGDVTEAVDSNFIIIGKANSYAEKYAQDNEIAFYDALNCAHCYSTTQYKAATLFSYGSKTEVCRACGNVKKTKIAKRKVKIKSLKSGKSKFVVKAPK